MSDPVQDARIDPDVEQSDSRRLDITHFVFHATRPVSFAREQEQCLRLLCGGGHRRHEKDRGDQGHNMAKLALFMRLDAKPGKEREVEALLQSVLPLLSAEPGTRSWYALKMAPQIYGVFDTFDNESDRETRLSGPVAKALTQRASELLSRPPVIEKVQILDSVKPGAAGLAAVRPPAKDPSAPQTRVNAPAPEVPKVGSQDAPGG